MSNKRLDGEELIAALRYDYIENESIIKVYYDNHIGYPVLKCELTYRDGELYWQPNTFKASMLFDECYSFEITDPKEEGKISKIKIDELDRIQAPSTGNYVYKLTQKEKIIIKKINEVIDYVKDNGF